MINTSDERPEWFLALGVSGLPIPMANLIDAATVTANPLERAMNTSLACEALTKWLVAVQLAGRSANLWPDKIQKYFQGNNDELRPGFGQWVGWASAAEAFKGDPACSTALWHAVEHRNAWAHGYSHPAVNSPLLVGTPEFWKRLLGGPAVAKLRDGHPILTDDRWPSWSTGSQNAGSLAPWVMDTKGDLRLLQAVRRRDRRGFYGRFLGDGIEELEIKLDHVFRSGGASTEATTPAESLPGPTGEKIQYWLRSQHRLMVIVGNDSVGWTEIDRHLSVAGVRTAQLTTVDDLGDVLAKVLNGERWAIWSPDEMLAARVREDMVAVETVPIVPPTNVEVVTSIAREWRGRVLRAANLESIAASTQTLGQLIVLLSRIKQEKPKSWQELQLLSARIAAETEIAGSTRSQGPLPAWPASFGPDEAATLHALNVCDLQAMDLGVLPHAKSHCDDIERTVKELGPKIATASRSRPIDLGWGVWLERWIGVAEAGVSAAAQALIAIEDGHDCTRAQAWQSRIGVVQLPDDTLRFPPLHSAFIAAVIARCVDEGIDTKAIESSVSVLCLEALDWLVRRVKRSAFAEDLLTKAASRDLTYGRATGRQRLISAIARGQEGPDISRWGIGLEQVAGTPVGDAARAVSTGRAWRELLAGHFVETEWRCSPLAEEHHAAPALEPECVADLVEERHAENAARRAMSVAGRHGLSTPEGRRWFEVAHHFAAAIANPFFRSQRFCDLAQLAARNGDLESARRLLAATDFGPAFIEGKLALAPYEEAAKQGAAFEEALALILAQSNWHRRAHSLLSAASTLLHLSAPLESHVTKVVEELRRHGHHEAASSALAAYRHRDELSPQARGWVRIQAALQPGVLALRPYPATVDPPNLPQIPERMVTVGQPGTLQLSDSEVDALLGGVVVEALIRPGEKEDWEGLATTEVGGDTPTFFSLRLGWRKPHFAVETACGLPSVQSRKQLAVLSHGQGTYKVRGAYDGKAVWVEVDDRVEDVTCASGLLRRPGRDLFIGMQQPGVRPFSGSIEVVRLWGRDAGRWRYLVEATVK